MNQPEISILSPPSRSEISKRSPLETLNIPDTAFDQATKLCVGMQFDHWNHAYLVLLAYGQKAGFVWRIQDKYPDKNGGVYKYVFECRHAGKFQSKKTTLDPSKQRNRESVKTDCTCFINMCWALKSPGPIITKMNLTHYGHSLNPETIKFANVYRQLPQNVMDKIEFYVNTVRGIDQHTLRQLLIGEFKDQLFLDKDLANAIQHFRKGDTSDPKQDPENDASNLLKKLQELKENDPTWFISYHCVKNRLYHLFWITPYQQTLYLKHHDVVLTDNTARTNKFRMSLCLFVGVDAHRRSRLIAQALMSDETSSSYMWVLKNLLEAVNNLQPLTIYSDCDTGLGPAIETIFPSTRYLHCIFHIVQNIKKHLIRPLGSKFTEFQTKFFSCRNTLFETIFEARFEALCVNFPEASSYLRTVLYPIKYRWAKCFTFQEFNAGMSSTQRVESINAIIHKYVNSHSSLMECFDGIQNMLYSELQKAEYRDYLSDLPFSIASSSAVRVFPKLVESLREFLTEEVFRIQKAQIDICFEYYSRIIPSEQYDDCDNVDDSDTSTCLEDFTDKSQVALKSLMDHVNSINILEIWEVKHMATNTLSTNYVALCHDYSHICTCLLLISEGLVCRHFFQVMLRTQNAKFAISLVKNRWYKKDVDSQNINTIYDCQGIYNQDTNTAIENSALNSMHEIQNFRKDCLSQDPEIDHSLIKRQIYGECAALGRKLATLAAEYNLTHVSATLRGLIQQAEQSNIGDTRNQLQEIVQNPVQANAKGRPAKRLKSCVENSSKNSKGKHTNTNVRSVDAYTCRNCLLNGHNARSCVAPCKICKESGHTYLHCQNKENV